jgi:hypothetical protein
MRIRSAPTHFFGQRRVRSSATSCAALIGSTRTTKLRKFKWFFCVRLRGYTRVAGGARRGSGARRRRGGDHIKAAQPARADLCSLRHLLLGCSSHPWMKGTLREEMRATGTGASHPRLRRLVSPKILRPHECRGKIRVHDTTASNTFIGEWPCGVHLCYIVSPCAVLASGLLDREQLLPSPAVQGDELRREESHTVLKKAVRRSTPRRL